MNVTQYNTVQMSETCFVLLFTAILVEIFLPFLQCNKLRKSGSAISYQSLSMFHSL